MKKDVVLTTNSVLTSSLLQKVILGLQHLIAMFGATVLVPYLTGLNPSIALFTAGLGTLIFHSCTKFRIPVFLGSSFAFIPVILTVKEMYNGDLAYAQGGIIVAGLLYILLSFLVYKIGVERIKRILAPQVVGPIIIVIALNLLPTAINMSLDNTLIALLTLLIAILISGFVKGLTKQFAILIGVILGYVVSLCIGFVDTSIIKESSLFVIPPFQFPKFDIGAILVIVPVVLAVFMEHLGDITTISVTVGEDFIKDPGLHRTLLGDGLATAVAGLIGGPANTTYGENIGVLAITKNYDPFVLRLSAIFAIVLSFVGKVGAVLYSIPTAVMGGISIMLFSMIGLIGVKTIKNSKVELNIKNIIVMIVILVIGLGGNFGLNLAIPLSETVSLSGLSLASIIGVILNLIINR